MHTLFLEATTQLIRELSGLQYRAGCNTERAAIQGMAESEGLLHMSSCGDSIQQQLCNAHGGGKGRAQA